MRLELMTEEDVELRVRMETDPGLMSELGGPRPKEDIERAHAKSLLLAAEGECWPVKIIPDGSDVPAGNVDIFRSSHDGEDIYEIGWMILPEFQGRGLASRAVHEMLERARNEHKFGRLHAFPGVTNEASNRICEKNGFTKVGEVDVEFSGRPLRCNHWWIDLSDRLSVFPHTNEITNETESTPSDLVRRMRQERHERAAQEHC
jgi:RimJ/RimL family protein N-acetyltransferase